MQSPSKFVSGLREDPGLPTLEPLVKAWWFSESHQQNLVQIHFFVQLRSSRYWIVIVDTEWILLYISFYKCVCVGGVNHFPTDYRNDQLVCRTGFPSLQKIFGLLRLLFHNNGISLFSKSSFAFHFVKFLPIFSTVSQPEIHRSLLSSLSLRSVNIL